MCSRNLLVTLRMSDRSRCGAVRILTWLAQPPRIITLVAALILLDPGKGVLCGGLWKALL
jgi:hypothetical protein